MMRATVRNGKLRQRRANTEKKKLDLRNMNYIIKKKMN